MAAAHLTALQRQIYGSAPGPQHERGRRRTAFGLILVLGCERLLREGRIVGRLATLAAAQVQAARLLVVEATDARWPTRRGDLLRRRAEDGLAAALASRARTDVTSAAAALVAAHDLLDEVVEWLLAGSLGGAAAPAAIDRLRVAQALLREHRFDDAEPLSAGSAPAEAAGATAPASWLDED